MSKHTVMNRTRLYSNKPGGQKIYIDNFLESNVEILTLVNNDTAGQKKIFMW